MKIHPFDNRRPGMLMFAPDIPGGVSAGDSPTGSPIPSTQPAGSSGIQQTKNIPVTRTLGPVEAGILPQKPSKDLKKMQQRLREKVEKESPVTLPPEPPVVPKPADAPPAPAASEAPVAEPVVPAPGATQPVVAAAAPPAEEKIKVGEKEYTRAELEERLKEKPEPAPAPVAKVEPPKPPTPEELAAQQKADHQRDLDWIAARAKEFKPESYGIPLNAESLETILLGGPEALSELQNVLGSLMEATHLRARKSLVNDLNPVLNKVEDKMKPVLEHLRQIHDFQSHRLFATKYADLQAHTAIVEDIRESVREAYDLSRSAIDAGRASEKDKNFVANYEAMSPEQYEDFIAENARGVIKKYNIQPSAAPAAAPGSTPAVVANPNLTVVPPPAPKPPGGQVSHGGVAPGKGNFQRIAMQEIVNR